MIIENEEYKIISRKGNIYKALKIKDNSINYIVDSYGDFFVSNGLRSAMEGAFFNALHCSHPTFKRYKNMNVNRPVTLKKIIKIYRTVTGACEEGVKNFINNQDEVKSQYSVKEIAEITAGYEGNETFIKYFKLNKESENDEKEYD